MILYHYTNLETLQKILISKKLRFRHTRNMNDSSDGIWLAHLLNQINDQKNKFSEQIIEDISYKPNFVFCMSEKIDLLSLWTRYADDAKGVAIGFNSDKFLIKENCQNQDPSFYHRLGFSKCVYDTNEQMANIKRSLEKIESIDDDSYKEIVRFSSYYKHFGFAEEQEWRIVDIPFEFTSDSDFEDSKIEVGVIGNSLFQYIDLSFDAIFNDSKNAISHLILGPNSKTDVRDLKRLVGGVLGHHTILINQSSIPYRGK